MDLGLNAIPLLFGRFLFHPPVHYRWVINGRPTEFTVTGSTECE
jgi:hypothetical protein